MQLAGFIKQTRIKQDDLVEFEKLFKSFYSPLCHYAFKFNIQISIKSYLYRAIRNNSLKYLEHVKVVKKYEQNFIETNSNDAGLDSNELELKELNDIIETTLNDLPERCSQIFKLSRFEGLKYNEIAEKLSISVKTVEANMGKALQLFRKNLKQYEEIAC